MNGAAIARKLAPLLWLALIGIAGWVLVQRLRMVDAAEVLAQLRATPAHVMLGALACSAGVYALVGLYEGLAVRLATGRRMVIHPLRTALIANPIGRAIGVAMISAGALRYRMYATIGMSARQIGAVIVLAAMPYLIAVGWLIDLSLLFNAAAASGALRLPHGVVLALGSVGLMKDVGWLFFVSRRREPIVVRGQPIRVPGLRDTLIQTAFGLAQLSLMTLILFLFMPAELGMRWPAFVAIYCIAFAAGQLSNAPAGLGVFEAALLLLLPHVPPAKLLGAVLAYRAVYELLPLAFAVVLLLIFEGAHPHGIARRPDFKRTRRDVASPKDE